MDTAMMTDDLDATLGRLSGTTLHAGLDGLEDRVLAEVAARRAQARSTPSHLTIALGALLLGALSNALPAMRAEAAAGPSPLNAPGRLAPSTLLLGGR